MRRSASRRVGIIRSVGVVRRRVSVPGGAVGIEEAAVVRNDEQQRPAISAKLDEAFATSGQHGGAQAGRRAEQQEGRHPLRLPGSERGPELRSATWAWPTFVVKTPRTPRQSGPAAT